MIDPRILRALDIPADATDAAVGRHLRGQIGLPPSEASDPSLWARFIEGIQLACETQGTVDLALLANRIVEYSIVPADRPGAERWGTAAWDRELGVPYPESDDRLRMLVIDDLAPRLSRAGLVAIIDYA